MNLLHPITLRRVKTWLRPTTIKYRLNSLCMINIERLNIDKNNLIFDVINIFGMKQRIFSFVHKYHTLVYWYFIWYLFVSLL